MRKNILIEREDGEIVTADHLKPDGESAEKFMPLIIMARGFPKYKDSGEDFFSTIGSTICDAGLSCLIFDYTRAAAVKPEEDKFTFESAGQDLSAVLAWAKKEGYGHVAFIAEGLGAAIVCMHCPENTLFSVFFWPALDFPHVRNIQFHAEQQANSLEKNGFLNLDGTLISQDFLEELDTTDLIPHLRNIDTPVLILQGADDTVAAPDALDIARKDLMASRLVITSIDQGTHGLPNPRHRKASMLYIKEFIEQYAHPK